MSTKRIPIEFDKSSVKMILEALDRYEEAHPLGSPIERERFCDIYRKLKISLFELTFMEGSP